MSTIQEQTHDWISAILQPDTAVRVSCIRQGWGEMQQGCSINGEPMQIHGRPFSWGLGSHADSEIIIQAPPMRRLRGFVGLDENTASNGLSVSRAILEFWIEAGGKELWRSPLRAIGDDAIAFDIELHGERHLTLKCRSIDGNLNFAHGDWAELVLELGDGHTRRLGEPLGEPLLEPRIPLSFTYGGRYSDSFLNTWHHTKQEALRANGCTVHTLTWSDPETGLVCTLELTQYPDFPAAEWVVRFHNPGDHATPVIEQILPLDLQSDLSPVVTLHRSRGSHCSKNDFAYSQDVLEPGGTIRMTPAEGRSSSAWLPFFNLVEQKAWDGSRDFRPAKLRDDPARGCVIAIGWTGCWSALFDWSQGSALKVQAGLQKTHLRLHPGESIRTPSILLLNWKGKPIDGNNALRQFILKYHTPRQNGQTVTAPLCSMHWGGMRTAAQLERVDLIQQERLPYDYHWVDAGWYGPGSSYSPDEHTGDWSHNVGDWRVNPVAHPDGFGPLSKRIHQAGMKFLLWFEPERAIWGTPLTREHPEWFLGDKRDGTSVMLNLGLSDARTWLTEFMLDRITSDGIDCYRQDFNIDPLPHWRAADAPDRVGMTEIKHIEGLYEFWDTLLTKFPHLVIDNCASGGRRIDLESVSRSIPLWRSDVQCYREYDVECAQSQTLGLNPWVPLNACGTHMGPGDTYRFRSCLSSGIVFHLFPYETSPIDAAYPYDWHRKMMADFLRARPFFTGEFYPLTPFQQSNEAWAGFQCHRDDLKQGFVLVFRRTRCPYSVGQLALHGLDPGSCYEFDDADSGVHCIASGGTLANDGLPLTIGKPRTAKLLFYKKLQR